MSRLNDARGACADGVAREEWDCRDSAREKGVDADSDEEADSASGSASAPREWVVYKRRVEEITAQSRACGLLLFASALLILCLVSFIFCQSCLFAILVICACLCPFYPVLNGPLWLAIILLTVGGWSFTTGALSITWKAQPLN